MKRSGTEIAITGCSAVSSAGIGIKPAVEAVMLGVSCLKPLPDGLVKSKKDFCWGKVEGFKATDFIAPLKARKLDRASQFAVAVAGLALADAGLSRGAVHPERIGIALGSGFGGIANSCEFLSGYYNNGISGLSPMLFPNTVANAAASNASIEYGIKGPNITIIQRFCSAESALMSAFRYIEEGRADIMLAGGVDELTPQMIHAFDITGQLKSFASGFGEGCGMLVLERAENARRRGAEVKALLTGINTIGFLVPGSEQQGINHLFKEQRLFNHLAVSGTEEVAGPLIRAVTADSACYPGKLIGRSLAMGGIVLGILTSLLKQDELGLQLASSPQGPYFAITLKGGDSV